MAGPADEIIVRLTADSSGLSAGLQSGADQVQSASDQMAQAAQAAAAQVNEAQASMAQASGGAADAFDASTTAMQASMDALAANITAATEAAKAEIAEMVAAAGGGTAGLAVSQAVAADAAAFNAAAMARAAAAGNLSAAMAGGITSTEGLAAAESALDEAMATGAVTASEFAAIQVELGAAEDALTAQVDANTASVEANTAANEENAVSGAGRTHGVYGAFSAVMAGWHAVATPLGGLSAVVALLGVDAAIAQSHIDDLTNAVAATGGATSESSGQILAWADQIGATVSTVDIAEGAFQKLAMSGEFVGQNLHNAGDAAVTMAQLTGESATTAASAIEKMVQSGSGVDALNAKFHFLTAAQKAEVDAAYSGGHAAGGETMALAALAAQLDKTAHSVGSLQGAWDSLKSGLESTGTGLAVGFGGGTDTQQLAYWKNQAAQHQVETYGEGGLSAAPSHARIEQNVAHYQALVDAHRKAAQLLGIEGGINSGVVSGFGKSGLAADTHYLAMEESIKNLQGPAKADYAKTFWEHIRATAPAASVEGMAAYQHLGQLDLAGEHAAHVSAATHTKNLYDSIWNAGPPSSAAGGAHIAAVHAAAAAEAVQKTSITSQASHSEAMLGMQRSHVQAMASMGTISQSGALAQEQSLADQLYAIKYNEYQKELALTKDKPAAQATVNAELVRAQDTLAQQTQTINHKQSAATIKSWQAVVAPVGQAVSGIVTGYVEGTLTMQQAQLRLGSAIVAEVINTATQSVLHWTAKELAQTGATAAGVATRLALTVAGDAEALAIQAATAIKWILTEAAKAAAGAFSAMAGIPIVGPALAVAAGAATFVAVEALVSNVASAQGGFERVPFDNMPAVLHKDEQVLPAQYAEGLRNLVAGGGNGGTTHVHIHAMDSGSFESFMKRNPQALMRALGSAHRTGFTAA